MTSGQRDITRKLPALDHADQIGNASKTCRYFGISRDTSCRWKRDYLQKGEQGLINSKPCPHNPKLRTPLEIEEKILYLRKTYHLGQVRISWYLKRYHEIKIAPATVYNVLERHGLNRLPRNAEIRAVTTHRYEKQVPGPHIQVDVKLLKLPAPKGA